MTDAIEQRTFTCPKCGRVSHNPRDAAQRYCGVCGFLDDAAPSLGPCCGCERDTGAARTVVMLNYRNKVPGHGWGCFLCRLPLDGAVAVLCDDCTARLERGEDVIRFSCRGYPGEDGRAPLAEFTEPFDHTVDHS